MSDRFSPSPRRLVASVLLCLVAAAFLASCSPGVILATSGNFVVEASDPPSGATLFLNDPIAFDFSKEIDLQSVSAATVTLEVRDTGGNPLPEVVAGTFVLDTRPGDNQPGRRLRFEPRIATDNAFTNGSFRAERVYVVRLPGSASGVGATLLTAGGTPLAQTATFVFSTPIGTQSSQLYRNPLPNGPRRTGFDITSANVDYEVPLGLFGAPPLAVRLHFDQALNPSDDNVPVNFDTDPLVRSIADRGNVFLEYDDAILGPNTWIPADVSLERNDQTGATIVLHPVGVLPNKAEIKVIVEPTLEDIAGESNLPSVNYSRVFAAFKTSGSYEQQWNGIVEDFAAATAIDPAAVFAETPAEVGPGFVRAGFAFEGTSTALDYQPSGPSVVLNTAFTQITPTTGVPINVAGGVFNFRNVNIPQGVTVVGQGPNPMVWLCTGTFTVDGMLSVRGGNGATVNTLQSANFPKAGGIGNCGGGNGGDGTPSTAERDLRGGNGRGPGQQADRGGRGGYLACAAGCYTGLGYNGSGGGSGGGGGTMATQGDLNWRGTIPTGIVPNTSPSANTSFQQVLGYGGSGCSGTSVSRTAFLTGGEPGDLVFVDARLDNNFWGSAVDFNRKLRVTGELALPIGGSGGGGGGDTSPANNCSLTGGLPANDFSGGGGGAGGGVLIIKALDQITITATGKIIADGGHGGGGEQVGACGEAGGGGGGAGGMVVLMSAKGIVIEAHGDPSVGAQGRFVYGSPTTGSTATHPFLGNDYEFAISADGGVCTTGGFGSVNVAGKYRPNGQSMLPGTTYDAEPLGGLGGMGIVQLMAPPSDNAIDGTNTRLDDNIHFRLPGVPSNLSGAQKRQLLAWRGFPNALGIFVDDFGNPTNIGNNEGDIRPAPVLLPVPFQARSRARSKWIDTGASQRRPLAAADGLPRGIVTAGGAVVGPVFEFAGLAVASTQPGYVDYSVVGSTAVINQPIAVAASPIQLIDQTATYLGQPAVRIRLAVPSAALAPTDRYVQYEAELLDNAGTVLAGFRILSHDQQELLVNPDEVIPTGAVAVQVRAKFFSVATNGVEGLGATYTGSLGVPIPLANVRIGFAFHQSPDPNNLLLGRYPASSEDDFVHDLADPALQAWIATNGAPRYVQWDVVFDMQYAPNAAVPPSLTANPSRQALEFLRLPFRF